jgi:hypothetical protein
VDDEQGIYRVEVLAIMGALPDLTVNVRRFSATSRETTTMKRKKKIGTPEERAARRARSEARIRELRGHIERITAELAARKRPA